MSYSSAKRIVAAACVLGIALTLIVQAPIASDYIGNAPVLTVASGSAWNGAAPHEATPDGTINAI